ncbi:hypothetical protein T265_10404 [Opisthorchis viverrini]|uniref:Uncharacterized protein n=1 Tax=Opisthorchis viverrini TaxID=6198 RepID=A0A074Z2E3_OPIVI|nr:hypothetical protein T265_10404 [Opisthorchis viverrini]KER21216.1 hypothetical protein T265_10404 [Opisthorchis viverrini]
MFRRNDYEERFPAKHHTKAHRAVLQSEKVSSTIDYDGYDVLRMPKHRLPRRVLFSVPPSGWRKPRGGQHMTWQKGVKEITKSLGVVGVVRLPGWGPRDPVCVWLETLQEMAANQRPPKMCKNRLATKRLTDIGVRRMYQDRLLESPKNAPSSELN